MAGQTFFPISELSTYHSRWTIRARVTAKGQLRSFSRNGAAPNQVFDTHLLDESDSEIRASFFGPMAEQYFGKLQQGSCYTFSRGNVRIANRQYNRCNHRYELVFDRDAAIEEVADIAKIETVKFAFTDLHAVQSKAVPCTVDLCGVVTSFKPPFAFSSREGRELVKREIVIADDTSTSMTIALWGDRAKQEDKVFEGHPVVCLKSVTLREWNGGRTGSLMEAGAMQVQPNMPEAQRLQQWWAKGGASANLTSLSLSQDGLVDIGALQTKTLPCTVELCGVIVNFRPTYSFTSKEGKELVKREITIADHSAASMVVTLWGARAQQEDRVFDNHALVSIKGVIVKEWKGARMGSLLEAGSLVFQPSTPEAEKVQQWWAQGGRSANLTSLSMSQEGLVDLRTLQTKPLPCTVELCGVIVNFRPTYSFTSKEGKELVKREITIADHTAVSMVVTLWGERAQQDDGLFDNSALVSIKGVLVKEWNGGRSGSLLEGGSLVFQPATPEAEKVQQWWAQGGSTQGLTALSQLGPGGAGAGGAASGRSCTVEEMRQAAELVSTQPEVFSVVGRLALVQTRKQGETQPLYYIACQEPRPGSSLACNKRVGEDGFCAACNRVGKAAPRLNLRCRFTDFTDGAWLTTFHETAQRVLSMSAEEAKAMEAAEGGREGLEAAIRRRYFQEPLQITVRARLDSYNGEPRTNITCADARPVGRGAHGRAMLKGIREMLGEAPVAAAH